MSGPELPQPIYPTQGPAPGVGGPPGGPATPNGPASPGGPGAPGPTTGSKNLLLIGIAVAVLVVGGIVAAVALGGNDGSSEGGGSEASGPVNTENGAGSTSQGRDTSAGGEEPRGGQGDPDIDAVADAEAITEVLYSRVSPAAQQCMVDALAADDELRGVLVGQVSPQISDGALASSYASTVMGCVSSAEMVTELEVALSAGMVTDLDQAYGAEGLTAYQIGCVTSDASMWSTEEWEAFAALTVQPARAAEVDQILTELALSC